MFGLCLLDCWGVLCGYCWLLLVCGLTFVMLVDSACIGYLSLV